MNAKEDDLESCESSSKSMNYGEVCPYEVLPYYDYIKKNRFERNNEENHLKSIEDQRVKYHDEILVQKGLKHQP